MNRMSKLLFIALAAALISLTCLTAFAEEAEDTPYVKSDRTSITIKNGESATIHIKSNALFNASWDNTSICTVSWGYNKTGSYSKDINISAKGVGKTEIKVFHNENPEVYTTISVTVTMNDEERKLASSVHWIADRDFFFYENGDAYVLRFSFKDENETRIAVPATVKIRIENDKGETVYEKTRYVTSDSFSKWTNSAGTERFLASVYIDPKDILPGEADTGTVYFEVSQRGYFSFGESKVSASKLPKIDLVAMSKLTLPEMPMTLSHTTSSGKPYTTVDLTSISYEVAEYSLKNKEVKFTIQYIGQKTYDSQGDNRNGACRFYWKLYDNEDYVVATGTSYTSAITTGEKFKNGKIEIYIKAGEYTLKFFDSVS